MDFIRFHLAHWILAALIPSFCLASSGAYAQQLNGTAVQSKVDIASDPEVLAAQRLFGAWIEGQIAYKGWAGVSVGVVKDFLLLQSYSIKPALRYAGR